MNLSTKQKQTQRMNLWLPGRKEGRSDPIKKRAEDLNISFSKGDIQMANRHMKRCSTSVINREMQIKTIMRYHFTTVRIAIIKKTRDKCQQGCGKNFVPVHCLWKCNTAAIENIMEVSQKLIEIVKLELPQHPAVPLLGIYQLKMKSLS